jgi:ubiquinone biosynthesis protein
MAEALAHLLVRLGGVFPKCGQLLGTRFDLFPGNSIEPLRRLHDALPPLDPKIVESSIEAALGCQLADVFSEFDSVPVGCGAVAQVHRARRRDTGELVAVKLRRPGLETSVTADLHALRTLARLAGKLPILSAYPVVAAIDQICLAISMQLDFELERSNQCEMRRCIGMGTELRIPRVHDDLCAGGVIVMEFISDLRRIDSADIAEGAHRVVIVSALRSLYRMLFRFGRVHCDMHPGNVGIDGSGRAVLIDFGLVANLSHEQVTAFRRLFMAISLGNAEAAAAVLLSTVESRPARFNRSVFTADVAQVVARSTGRLAGEFRVGILVTDLFGCLHRHRLRGSADFVLAIFSLLVFEGLTTQRNADLDFQREALPFMLAVPSTAN